ncbi:MAG: NAD(P)/FAD-dependent oxidoreductase [Gammaproteobacteria bacterium]|nr:NAD(P)/FAD-dependent oxidoreductase [Gammaproteobacteria bacterium]
MNNFDHQPGAELDVVVVGAGFAGLYLLYRLRELGLSVRVLEAGSGPGGTWYWNRYPGARCDVLSMEYSYQFSPELQADWVWRERYATQPEILHYINHVADRFDLRGDLQFNTRVDSAHFDEAAGRWQLTTDTGEVFRARFCVMATGCLSSTNLPDFPGRQRFTGATYHTGRWPPAGVDFTGQRVGIIGTGSSAIQSIPHIAEQAAHLTVFQRTPSYSIPARNAPLGDAEVAHIKADYANFRARNRQMSFGVDFRLREEAALSVSAAEREREYHARWAAGGLAFLGAFSDLLVDQAANDTAAEFIRQQIKAVVSDPLTAEKLTPTQIVGCKRLCVDSGYYETFNRSNVTLVDVSDSPIEAITAQGVRVAGQDYPFDSLIFATGFDAMTGALAKIDIRGRAGRPLSEKWAAGPRTYLGLGTVGFPNLFLMTGPGSPSVLTNMLPSIEQHADWISSCIAYVSSAQIKTIEATLEAEDAWVEHVNVVAHTTLYPSCNSWYLGANVPGKPRVFMPYIGFPPYVAKCDQVAANGYEGFELAH